MKRFSLSGGIVSLPDSSPRPVQACSNLLQHDTLKILSDFYNRYLRA
jgi:hypothetical protein